MCKCGNRLEPIVKYCDAPGCRTSHETSQFQMGDMVYSPMFGWGGVRVWQHCNYYVQFTDGNGIHDVYFDEADGRYYSCGEVMLFHDKPTIVPAKKFHDKPTIVPAKKMVKKWTWAYETRGIGMSPTTSCAHFSTRCYQSFEKLKEYHNNINIVAGIRLPWTEVEEEE